MTDSGVRWQSLMNCHRATSHIHRLGNQYEQQVHITTTGRRFSCALRNQYDLNTRGGSTIVQPGFLYIDGFYCGHSTLR